MKTTKRSAAEKIADLTGCEIQEVREGRYNAGKLNSPSVFVVGEDYFAACESMPKHKVGQPWQRKTTFRGDVVWESLMEVV